MKKLVIAIAAVAFTFVSPGIALASNDASSHNGEGGHGGHGGGNAPTVAGARKIKVKAGTLDFTPADITVASGEDVIIVLKSTDVAHDFVVKGIGHVVGTKSKKAAKGGLRIDVPGTYRFWCSITGHRSGGMKGTITVQ